MGSSGPPQTVPAILRGLPSGPPARPVKGEQAAAEAAAQARDDGGEAERADRLGRRRGGTVEGGVGAAGEAHHQAVTGAELVGEQAGEEAEAGLLVGRGAGLGGDARRGRQLGRFLGGE
jgi:hypothetical protein